MIKDIFSYIFGFRNLTVAKELCTIAADLANKAGVASIEALVNREGEFVLKIPLLSVGRLRRIFDEAHVDYELSDIRGLPYYLWYLITRPGLGVGFVLFFILMYISGRTVWTITVDGNEKLSDEYIIGQLSKKDFTYGTYIPAVDFDQLHAEYLAEFQEISWISVNMNGTHANVRVREKRLVDSDKITEGTYANIVASEDAVVTHEETSAGLSLISQGDVVRKGDLLVSGIIPLRNGGERFTYAQSKVFAYVPRSFEVTIPFKTTEKVYSGVSFTKKTVKIFKKSINLSINSGIECTTYDKIVRSRRISFFGVIPLPVWVEETEYKEYYFADKKLTVDKAVSTALAELRNKLDDILSQAELTASNFSYNITDECFKIKCELTCITDIAKVMEFTADVSDTGKTEE